MSDFEDDVIASNQSTPKNILFARQVQEIRRIRGVLELIERRIGKLNKVSDCSDRDFPHTGIG